LVITSSSVGLQARLRPIPLRCPTAQHHQTICAVIYNSRALATFQNVGKAGKQGEAIGKKCVDPAL